MRKCTFLLAAVALSAAALLSSCRPQVATSFWAIGTPAYSDVEGYTVIQAQGETRHCYPITEACEPAWDPEYDTYHMFHHHGVAVESELMAYRIFFDKRQTVDVYCKRTPRLELATGYWYPNDSLLAEGYGDDILRVGETVGVGSVRYWNGQLCDIEEVGERQEWIVSKSRKKATISISDVDWSVPDGKQDSPFTRTMVYLAAEYTMRAGHRDMRCDVRVSKPIKGLCTGVQCIPAKGENQKSEILNLQLQNGVLLASWGTDWPKDDTVKYAKETVGLGVFIPKECADETVQDESNNLCLLTVKSGMPDLDGIPSYRAHFYLIACGATKENHPVATTAEEWFDYLRKWAKNLK